jgi:7,8-dihydropterin-6-yl-methyl-4-(beta-D-ribofuranosyl)aminobenzene 5'-phosphate synthase
MKQLKITVLNDNTAGRFCLAEHGLSFWIESTEKYLFDTSTSDLFLENARRIGIDINNTNTVVLSHGHDDHTGGLRYLKNKIIVAHPDVFMNRYRKSNASPLGFPFSRDEAENQFEFQLQFHQEPFKLDATTWFLGEIPRNNDFEAKETPFIDENGNDDFVPDDSGMAVVTKNGLVVISGCAHSGICNMIEHARQATGVDKVFGVIGGFHLTQNNEQTQRTIKYFQQLAVEKVMPSHCTALPALAAFHKAFDFVQVKSGNTIIF